EEAASCGSLQSAATVDVSSENGVAEVTLPRSGRYEPGEHRGNRTCLHAACEQTLGEHRPLALERYPTGRYRDRRTLVSAPRCESTEPGSAAQAAVYERALVHSGSPEGCVRAFDRPGERQDRGLVYSVRNARGES